MNVGLQIAFNFWILESVIHYSYWDFNEMQFRLRTRLSITKLLIKNSFLVL